MAYGRFYITVDESKTMEPAHRRKELFEPGMIVSQNYLAMIRLESYVCETSLGVQRTKVSAFEKDIRH
jgi:hypothetical protein